MSEPKTKPKARPLESLDLSNNAWPVGEELHKKCPKLWELLMPVFEDKTMVRQPGRLSIAVDSGHWKVTLNLPTEQVQSSFYVDELFDLWEVVEIMILDHRLVWVNDYHKKKKEKPVIGD